MTAAVRESATDQPKYAYGGGGGTVGGGQNGVAGGAAIAASTITGTRAVSASSTA